MFSGWRAPLHYWSRHRRALKTTAISVALTGFVTAWLFILLFPKEDSGVKVNPMTETARNAWRRLSNATAPQPRDLALWLRRTTRLLKPLCRAANVDETTWASYQKDGRLVDLEVRSLIRKHAVDPETVAMFEDFLAAQLLHDEAPGPEAAQRVQERARRPNPPPLANELYASVLLAKKDSYAALNALFREATLFPEATSDREEALRLALTTEDTENVRQIAAMPGWLERMPPLLQHQAGVQLQDPWLQWRSLFQYRLTNVPYGALFLALFAALLWYVILVLHSTSRQLRWILPIAPLMAGVLSVWPALTLSAWQEVGLNMREDAPFPYDLWYFVAGVGLREELAKLLLFSLFLPWLLWRRQPGLALITGAFVGLGFALEENLDYYQDFGGAVALTRFLSANFLHIAFTGIAAHALYEMLRTRFARADQFIGTFLAVVVAHGLYDYLSESEEMSYFALVFLAFIAWRFLDLVERESPASRQTVSPIAVFLLGTATLMAVSFWMSALEDNTIESLTDAAEDCLGILPVAIIYWRRF